MVGSAGRNLSSALDTACGLGWGSKYRENTGDYVSDVFGNDHTGNLEESELFSSGN
jgi:hypothetical protein